MSELNDTDQGMEGLFRKAADQAHYAFDGNAWAKMEAMLDAPPAPATLPSVWWAQLLSWLTITIVLILLWMPLPNIGKRENRIQAQALAKATFKPYGYALPVPKNKLINTPKTAPMYLDGEVLAQEPEQQIQNEIPVGGAKREQPLAASTSITGVGNGPVQSMPPTAKFGDEPLRKRQKLAPVVAINKPGQGKQTSAVTLAETPGGTELPKDTSTITTVSLAGKLIPLWLAPSVQLSTDMAPVELPDEEPQRDVVSPTQEGTLPKWSVLLYLAPDLNVVGSNPLGSPGPMAGVNIEYAIARRLSITTGVSHSIKKYGASGSEYTLPDEPWAEPENLDFVDASCNVIDIPLNLRYYFTLKERTRWYGSAGISSYLMLREDYDYDYSASYSNPGNWESWGVRNENQHYAGILNLSVGYEQRIGSRMGIGVEPYVKVPLARVGAGKVRLVSLGTLINIRYNLGKKKTNKEQ